MTSRTKLLSVVMIAQDNASTIGRVLASIARVADDIVVVDGGSSDHTLEIASEQPQCRIFERRFDDFASQKNFAIDQAEGRWVLLLDTDELLGARTLRWLRWGIHLPWVRWFKFRTCHLVRHQQNLRQVFSRKHYPDAHLRLFRNLPFFRYDLERGRVHESFPRKGRGFGIHLPLHIFHYGYAIKTRNDREARIQFYEQLAGHTGEINSMYRWEDDPEVTLIKPKESPPQNGLIDV